MSLEKGILIGFTPCFQTAYATAVVFSKLNISHNIRPIKMILAVIYLEVWANFLNSMNLTCESHDHKQFFLWYIPFTRFSW